jgi:galactonate dehydratase
MTGTTPCITAFDTYVVAVAPGINWTFLRLQTDAGIHGWGECTLEGKDLSVLAAVEELCRSLVGAPVPPPALAWSRFFRMAAWKGAALFSAMSGIDHALWDIAGKLAGLPVSTMLGGPVRERLHLYTWAGGGAETPTEQRRIVRSAHDAYGYTHFKLAPLTGYYTLDPAHKRLAVDRVEAVVEALPPEGKVAVEGHGRLLPAAAVDLAQSLTDYPLAFLEDFVNTDDEAAMQALRSRTVAPLAAGEKRYHRWNVWPLLRDNLVDYLLIDLCHAGGITEGVRIAALAETVGVGVVPHNPNGPIGMAATLHVAGAAPAVLAAESVHTRFPLMAELTGSPVEVVDGHMSVPTGPGLGVELDVDALESHRGTPADFPFTPDAAIPGGRL